MELENTAEMGKSRYRLEAKSTGTGLRVSIDGTQADLPADAWATSYWQIPERLAHPEAASKSAIGNRSLFPICARANFIDAFPC